MHRKMIEDICHNPEAETKEQQDHLIMMHKAENKKYAENQIKNEKNITRWRREHKI